MQKFAGTWWRALFFGLLFAIGYKIIDNFPRLLNYLRALIEIITPFIIGGVIAFFLYKPASKLEAIYKKARLPLIKKHARMLAISSVYLLFLLAIVFTVRFVVDAIYRNIADIIANWDMIAARAIEIFDAVNIPQKNEWLDKINVFLSRLLETEMLLKVGNVVGEVASTLLSVFTGLIVSIYMINEKDSLKSVFLFILKRVFPRERIVKINGFLRRILDIFYSYFTGLFLDAIVVGAISLIFYFLFGAPYPWLLGFVAAVGNMIPFFGPIIAAVVVSLATIITKGPIGALWVLAFQILLGQLDGNLIQPKILGNSVGISPFWVIFAVLFFGGIWGPLGMLLGVPIVAAVRMTAMNPEQV